MPARKNPQAPASKARRPRRETPVTPAEIAEIRARRSKNETLQSIAADYSVSRHYIHVLTKDLPTAPERRNPHPEPPAELTAHIIAAYQAGQTMPQLCRETGLSLGKVSRILNAVGPTRGHGARRLRRDPALQEQLCAFYAAGHPLHITAAQFDIGVGAATNYLRAAGLLRDRSAGRLAKSGLPYINKKRDLLALYQDGWSPREIAQVLKVSAHFVRQTAKAAGYDTSLAAAKQRQQAAQEQRQAALNQLPALAAELPPEGQTKNFAAAAN